MTAKILGTKKDPFSVNVLESYAKKYIFHAYISFNIRFYSKPCHIKVLFGALKFFSVLFGGKSPFLSLVGPGNNFHAEGALCIPVPACSSWKQKVCNMLSFTIVLLSV